MMPFTFSRIYQFLILFLFFCQIFTLFVPPFDFNTKEFQAVYLETKSLEEKFKYVPSNYSLNCPRILPQNPPPTDVRNLRFSDIRFVGALGDSIVAGFAMADESYSTIIYEHRGRVSFIGGDHNYATIPNFLRHVSGQPVKGFSTGMNLPWSALPWRILPNNPIFDRLNGAQSNSKFEHLDDQLDYVLREGRKLQGWSTEWKFLSIFMGANNLCDCNSSDANPEVIEKELNSLIQKLNVTTSKIFVSIHLLFENVFIDLFDNIKDPYCLLLRHLLPV